MEFNHKTSNTGFRLLAAQLHRTKSRISLGLLLIAALGFSCLSNVLNIVIANLLLLNPPPQGNYQ